MEEYNLKISALENPTFQNVKSIASGYVKDLPKEKKDNLWNSLIHGVTIIQTHNQLCYYLYAYGDKHEAKIKKSLGEINFNEIEGVIDVIDWGCGQGLATMCLLDFFKENNINRRIGNIVLIEPSAPALNRAKIHLNAFGIEDSKIITVKKKLDEVNSVDIEIATGNFSLHLFSNIIDVKGIDLKKLAIRVDESVSTKSIVLTTSPYFSWNNRIEAFFNYFKLDKPIFDFKKGHYEYTSNKFCSIHSKIFQLEFNPNSNLIPIKYYPSVQFHAAYQADSIKQTFKAIIENKAGLDEGKLNNLKEYYKSIASFEVAAPFDIGASVYDDIHPIFAVISNIITRGLPTKASPFIEEKLIEAFGLSEKKEKYGEFYFAPKKDNTLLDVLRAEYKILESDNNEFGGVDIVALQNHFVPIAIARIQKTLVEAILTDKLNIESKKWNILAEEHDVPCAALAIADFKLLFDNLTKLSVKYASDKLPEINLEIINANFSDSTLHIGSDVSKRILPIHKSKEYDLVLDISNLVYFVNKPDDFSRFKCKNDCYFTKVSDLITV